MLNIRGKTVSVRPLTMTQMTQVFEGMRAPPTESGEFNLANLPQLVRATAMSIKPDFPGESVEDLQNDLMETLGLADFVDIAECLFANPQPYLHVKEAGHG